MSDFLFGHALARTRGRLVAPFYFGIGNPQLGGHDAAALHQRELARLDVKEEICPCDHNAGHAGKVSFHILCRDEVGVEVLHQDGPLRDSENVVADLGLEDGNASARPDGQHAEEGEGGRVDNDDVPG